MKIPVEKFFPFQILIENAVQNEQHGDENHVGNLQFQQAVNVFLNLSRRGQSAEKEKHGNVKQQAQIANFRWNIKLPRPENGVNENYAERGKTFHNINI
jgi:hypothetical protein